MVPPPPPTPDPKKETATQELLRLLQEHKEDEIKEKFGFFIPESKEPIYIRLLEYDGVKNQWTIYGRIGILSPEWHGGKKTFYAELYGRDNPGILCRLSDRQTASRVNQIIQSTKVIDFLSCVEEPIGYNKGRTS